MRTNRRLQGRGMRGAAWLPRPSGRGALVVVLLALATFVAPSASATPAPPANFTFASIGPGGGFDGGTDLAGPDELVGTADDALPLGAGNYGGLIDGPVQSNGGPAVNSSFYCVDLTVNISPGQTQTVGSWNAALTDILPGGRTNSLTAANLAVIAQIVTNNFPSPDTLAPLTGSDDDKALAVQWAIWHFSNGYTPGTALSTFTLGGLGTFATTPADVDANYATILAAVAAGTYPAVAEPQLPHLGLIAPPSTTAAAGGSLVGPYTVSAITGVDVSATPDGDGVIVDAAGTPLAGPFHDGDQFFVRKPTAGTVTVTLGANEALPIGAALTDPARQRLINAVAVVTQYTATATADFTGPLVPSIRVEKYDGTQSFTPDPAVATVDKDTDPPAGDADTLATALAGVPAAATPVKITLNNNGTAPLYDVTVSDHTTAGTGTITGLVCTFPDSSTGLFFPGPLDVGAVITCTGSLPALGFSASHVDQVTVFGRPGVFVGGAPAPDAGNPPTGTPITTPGPDVVTDQDLFTVLTPAAPRYAIGDYVFFDTNANGVQDAGDTPVGNVTVTLKDSGGATIATTTTDGSGAYHFDNLLAGDYTVVFTAPSGQVFTTQTAGSDTTVDSNPDAGGVSAPVTLGPADANLTPSVPGDGVTAPLIDRTIDAGLIPIRYAIGDYVFLDANANGVQDAGDTPVGNVTVTLRDSGGATIASTTTDANGAYHFDNLLAGDYRVDFTAPAGYSFTTQTAGSDTTVDSNPNASGVSATFTLGQGDTNLTPTVPFDLVTAPFIDRTIDAGLTLSPSNPSVRVEKYDGTQSFTPDGAVATAAKDSDAPVGDAESPATALHGVGTDPTPVKVTLNNNGDVPLYDVTVVDQTVAGTGTITGLSCTFPDSSTGLYFAGPLVAGAVVTCTGTLPALGDAATHEDQVTVLGRAGLVTGGVPTPDPLNPPTGQPITGPGTGIVTDTDLFNVDTPAATTTTTTTTIPDTTTTTVPDTTTTTVPDTTTTTVPDTTTTIPDTTTTTVPDTTTTTVPDTTTTTVPDTTTTTVPNTTTTTVPNTTTTIPTTTTVPVTTTTVAPTTTTTVPATTTTVPPTTTTVPVTTTIPATTTTTTVGVTTTTTSGTTTTVPGSTTAPATTSTTMAGTSTTQPATTTAPPLPATTQPTPTPGGPGTTSPGPVLPATTAAPSPTTGSETDATDSLATTVPVASSDDVSSADLPRTGVNAWSLVATGLACLLSGLALVLAGRRRQARR